MKQPDEIKKLLTCPWCGEQMRFDGDSVHVWYQCDNCWANSPKARRVWKNEKSNKENWNKNKANALLLIRKSEAKKSRWISVEERLPEGNADVIVYIQHPISGHCWMKIAHHVSEMGLDECVDDEWWLDGSGETVSYVTHWMPMPEPPKEEPHEENPHTL